MKTNEADTPQCAIDKAGAVVLAEDSDCDRCAGFTAALSRFQQKIWEPA